MIYLDEYEHNKKELLADPDRPYIFHNPELAADFFEQLKKDLPDVQFFEKDIPGKVAAQYIIASDQAKAALLGMLTKEKEDLEEALQTLDQLIGEISGKGATE